MKKTALYIRTSTNRQGKGHEAQLRALSLYCKEKDITNTAIYSDKGVSGVKSNRPALDELMKDIDSHRIDSVIVYSFSRFARSTKFLIESLEKMCNLSVGFISLTENIDTSTPTGKALFSIISAMSQLERDLISERVKNGLLNAKSKGKAIGRPRVVKPAIIQNLRSQGYSYRKISKLTGHSLSTISRTLSKISN